MNENPKNPFDVNPDDVHKEPSTNFKPGVDPGHNPFSRATAKSERQTLLNTIAGIDQKDTNYIFLFGRSGTGKSYITASLIYYLKTSRLGDLHLAESTSRESELLFEDMYNNFQTGNILDRTNKLAPPYEIDLIFSPKDRRLPDMKITFMEMSGENLEKVQITRDDPESGRLPDNIDVYFLSRNIRLIFFLVADHQSAAQDSRAIDKFLQYAYNKDRELHHANYLLAITKWDTYRGRHKKIEDFTEETMPNIHNRLYNKHEGNAITHYSIGKILKREVNGVVSELIQEIDTDRARAVTNWLYKTITGLPLVPEPGLWEKFKIWMGF